MTTQASTPAGPGPLAGRDLRRDGIDAAQVFWNPGVASLYEEAIRRGEV